MGKFISARVLHVKEVAMQKKLTITIDEEVYDALYKVIGPRKISKFIQRLVRPHVIEKAMEAEYEEMARQEELDKDYVEDWSGLPGPEYEKA